MGKTTRRSKEFVVMIALKYPANFKVDPEKVREFWDGYIGLLPITGLQGMDEAGYNMHGVSIYGQDAETP